MTQDMYGKERGVEQGAPAGERARMLSESLKKLIEDVSGLEHLIKKYQVYNDEETINSVMEVKGRLHTIHDRWSGLVRDAEDKPTEKPAINKPSQPVPISGRNEFGGNVFDMRTKPVGGKS
jgi:hypothetical protein